MKKGQISDELGYTSLKIKGLDLKDKAKAKLVKLQAKSAYIQGQMSAILANQKVMPNKPVSKWEYKYGADTEYKEYSYELLHLPQNEENPYFMGGTSETVSCSPLSGSEYSYNKEDCCVSEDDCRERAMYNNLVYELISLQCDIVTLDIVLSSIKDSQELDISIRTLGYLNA